MLSLSSKVFEKVKCPSGGNLSQTIVGAIGRGREKNHIGYVQDHKKGNFQVI